MTRLYKVTNSNKNSRNVLARDEEHLKEMCLRKRFVLNTNHLTVKEFPVDGLFNAEQTASLVQHAKNDEFGFLACFIDGNRHKWLFDK